MYEFYSFITWIRRRLLFVPENPRFPRDWCNTEIYARSRLSLVVYNNRQWSRTNEGFMIFGALIEGNTRVWRESRSCSLHNDCVDCCRWAMIICTLRSSPLVKRSLQIFCCEALIPKLYSFGLKDTVAGEITNVSGWWVMFSASYIEMESPGMH